MKLFSQLVALGSKLDNLGHSRYANIVDDMIFKIAEGEDPSLDEGEFKPEWDMDADGTPDSEDADPLGDTRSGATKRQRGCEAGETLLGIGDIKKQLAVLLNLDEEHEIDGNITFEHKSTIGDTYYHDSGTGTTSGQSSTHGAQHPGAGDVSDRADVIGGSRSGSHDLPTRVNNIFLAMYNKIGVAEADPAITEYKKLVAAEENSFSDEMKGTILSYSDKLAEKMHEEVNSQAMYPEPAVLCTNPEYNATSAVYSVVLIYSGEAHKTNY